MLKNKVIALILLATVFVSGKAYCQENSQMSTFIGKVSKMDEESGVVSVQRGSITKQVLFDAHLDADVLWGEFIKNGYIDTNGALRMPFYELDKYSDMLLPKKFNAKKRLIYSIFQKALSGNEAKVFYISMNSDLLRGTHHIASIEIEEGDPVTIQYESSSPDKNNVIFLVDNRSEE